MSWSIMCIGTCKKTTRAKDIVDLLNNFVNSDNQFICGSCNNLGYIDKSFLLQEEGETWAPRYLGAFRLEVDRAEIYQPFAFLLADGKDSGKIDQIQFCYYKDLRSQGGRLHVNTRTPVLSIEALKKHVYKLI